MNHQQQAARPRVLIEDWLPVKELGIESRRERAAASALPPLSFLHVWWARRPLVASAAVVLAGLLPTWTPDLAARYPDTRELSSARAYQRWLLHLVGIWGDPVAARAAYDAAVASGTRIPNPYTYKQAYRNAIPRRDIDLLHAVLTDTWGELPTVADPTAGGGSIPFTAVRLGLPAVANDLNGVAASVLEAGVAIPAAHGTGLTPHLEKWGRELVSRVEADLAPYFPSGPREQVATYLFANAVACPRTGRPVPLMKDKWLRKDKGKEAAIRVLLTDPATGADLPEPRFEVVTGRGIDNSDAAAGYVSRGGAVSPYDHLAIDGDWIKAEAQAGRMTQLLYAVAIRTPGGDRAFRAPTRADLDAIAAAEQRLAEVRDAWIAAGHLPDEDIPDISNYDRGHRMYGISSWLEMFMPRQALGHGTFAKHYDSITPEVHAALDRTLSDGTTDTTVADAVLTELALMQGKALNWNSRLSSWDLSRQKMRSVFDKHNFEFKWTFAEFEAGSSNGLYSWCLSQLIDAYGGIARLVDETGRGDSIFHPDSGPVARSVTVSRGSAAGMAGLSAGSVAHVCMDPPYYDNVMYAELSDFFYVWEERTLGRVHPDYFTGDLADKENEAVANPARFADMGRRKKELAELDYEAKMTAIFAEARRVLRDDGVLSVMFTHKRAEAWDTLGAGLLEAGFTIETSWPVNTEPEVSLHLARMNAAASTIILVCRKRAVRTATGKVFLDDIAGDIRAAAREAVTRFQGHGIEGVDLLLSTYGPVLSVISQAWPVHSAQSDESGRARLVRPEEALDIAREEVVRLQRARIVGRDTVIDDHTDFALLAWETFKAAGFPYDDARRLALAVGGLDVDDLARAKVLEKKAGAVRLLAPHERVRRLGDDSGTGVRLDATRFDYMNDAVDTVLYIAEVDGLPAAKRFMDRLGLTGVARFLGAVQGLVNAIPRTRVKGEWVVPQAGLLDTLVTVHLADAVELPPDPEPLVEAEQGSFFD